MQKLTVLMATYNGTAFLSEQIASISRQQAADIHLVVSDDGSTDSTPDLIRTDCTGFGNIRLTVLDGPTKGYVANFRSLVARTDPDSGYVAFSDQDDIWTDNKTRRAMEWLQTIPAQTPAV